MTVDRFRNLLSPMVIRNRRWKNRMVVAPKGGMKIADGEMEPQMRDMIAYYGQGHPAEIIIGETPVSGQAGRGVGEAYDFNDPKVRQGIEKYASLIRHEIGAIAMVELFHAGEQRVWTGDSDILGPMSYIRKSDGARIKAMTEEDIQKVCAEFASAALVMKECGFDGVVVHAGHGWLLHQFFSEKTNKRKDQYGGSLENRCRLTIMVLDAIREKCGEDFVIECRISGSEAQEGSYTLPEVSYYANAISQKADIIHISAGLYRDPGRTGMVSQNFAPHGLNLPIAEYVKAHGCKAAVSVVGGFNDPVMMEEAVGSGKADLIAMLREFTAEPAFPDKLRQGLAAQLRPCIRCMRCFPGAYEDAREDERKYSVPYFEMARHCSVNPEYYRFGTGAAAAAAKPKRVLVVGCGPGGLQAAITARRRGHSVTVIDRERETGGVMRYFKNDAHKKDLWRLAEAMRAEAEQAGVKIELHTPFCRDTAVSVLPDVIVAAVGAEPITSGIPGLGGRHIILAQELYMRPPGISGKAVILGGGMVGCEAALKLMEQGVGEIILVERKNELSEDAYRQYGIDLRERVRAAAECRMNTTCIRIEESAVFLQGDKGEEKIEADIIINALGMRARDTSEIKAAAEELSCGYYEIGDCRKAGNICGAIEEGYAAGNEL